MTLDGRQREQLHQALLSAFRTRAALEQVVRFGLNRRLSEIANGFTDSEIVLNLIEWTEAQDALDELITAARKNNPNNVELRDFDLRVWQPLKQKVKLDPTSRQQQSPSPVADQYTSVSTSITNSDFSKQETELNRSRIEVPSEHIEPVSEDNGNDQDFFATKHMHHHAIEQAFTPFKEGWNIYPEHCNRAIKSLDELDESLQSMRKDEAMLSYHLRGLLHQISEQVSNLRSEMYKCRKDLSPLTAILKRRFHNIDYKKIRNQFDLLLKSLEQFDDADLG